MKVCTHCKSKEYHREWRKKNRLKCRAALKRYADKNPEKRKLQDKCRKKKKEKIYQSIRRLRRAANPKKIRAQEACRYAIRVGKIKRGSCVSCKSPKVVAHHNDYSKPLDIIWLCAKHHSAWHRILTPEE